MEKLDVMVQKADALESMKNRGDPNYPWALEVFKNEVSKFKAELTEKALKFLKE